MIELPMKDCGACGMPTCNDFKNQVEACVKRITECPYMLEKTSSNNYNLEKEITISETKDLNGYSYDFILHPIGNELSARKLIRPFRPDLIEKLDITEGSYISGRPMGAGCPITHVLKVYKVDELSGVLYTWAVGPAISRSQKIIDIASYTIAGFEGIAREISKYPKMCNASGFLPSFCMLRLTHFGMVNQIYKTTEGLFVHLEDIHIY